MAAIQAAAKSEFESLFKTIIEKAAELNVDVTLPRVVGRQTYRSNIDADTPEKYYRVLIYIHSIFRPCARGVEQTIFGS